MAPTDDRITRDLRHLKDGLTLLVQQQRDLAEAITRVERAVAALRGTVPDAASVGSAQHPAYVESSPCGCSAGWVLDPAGTAYRCRPRVVDKMPAPIRPPCPRPRPRR